MLRIEWWKLTVHVYLRRQQCWLRVLPASHSPTDTEADSRPGHQAVQLFPVRQHHRGPLEHRFVRAGKQHVQCDGEWRRRVLHKLR